MQVFPFHPETKALTPTAVLFDYQKRNFNRKAHHYFFLSYIILKNVLHMQKRFYITPLRPQAIPPILLLSGLITSCISRFLLFPPQQFLHFLKQNKCLETLLCFTPKLVSIAIITFIDSK